MFTDLTSPVSPASALFKTNGRNRSAYNNTINAEVTRQTLARVLGFGDFLIALTMVFVVWLVTFNEAAASDFQSLLAMRVTVKNLVLLGIFFLIWGIVCRFFGLYQINKHTKTAEAVRITAAVFVGSLLLVPLVLTSHTGKFNFAAILAFWVTTVAAMLASRGVVHSLFSFITATTSHPRNILLVGSGPRAVHLQHELSRSRAVEHNFIGFVDDVDETHPIAPEVETSRVGTLNDLENILFTQVVDEVLIALPFKSHYADIERTIQICERSGIAVKYPLDIFESAIAKPQYEPSHLPTVSLKFVPDTRNLLVKRLIDVVCSLSALIALAPLMLAIAALIRLTDGGASVFSQERYGFNKRRFKMYKFRTMVVNAEALQASLENLNEANGATFKIKNDPRVTRLGRILRKTSLDELPQLWNVLRGDMSIVGPRPLPMRDVSKFDETWFMRRFAVRPGLTCLWQISGRSDADFSRLVNLDLEYIDNWSLMLDLKIILKTVPVVCKGSGAC
jgi:exopolysaccharide biosynthesis polyprenyl glycosylphosphotransferase